MSAAWIVVTGLLARSRLDRVRSDLSAYQTALIKGNTREAAVLGRRIRAQAGSAHQLTSGPAWWVGSHILGVGTPMRTARAVSYATDRLATEALPRLPALIGSLTGGNAAGSGRIDVDGLARAGTQLGEIRVLVAQSAAVVRASPASWLGPASDGRRAALTKLTSLDGELGTAVRAAQTIAPMLGATSPQRYFVAFMNEAESRSIGGLPGEFAILTADRGRLAVEHIGSDQELEGVRAHVDLGAQYRRIYASDDPTGVIQNSDIGPSFPDAARIWAGMWQAKSGEHVDGAIAIDPTALSFLLGVTGPAHLPDGSTVDAKDITTLAESKQYVRYPGFEVAQAARRKQFLAAIAQAVSTKLLGFDSPQDLLQPLRQAVRERRIVAWSADASHERTITDAGLGGVLQPGHAPFSAFFVNNASGSKLDFYLHRTMTYRAVGCGSDRVSTASVSLHNDTPDYRLPPYVTYVSGGRPKGATPGFNRVIVGYYVTPGSHISSVTLDGKVQHLSVTTEDGLASVRLVVDLPAHANRTLTVVSDEPATTGPVQIVSQPLVYALHLHTSQPVCSTAASPVAGNRVGLGPIVALIAGGLLLIGAAGVVAARARRVNDDRATETSDT